MIRAERKHSPQHGGLTAAALAPQGAAHRGLVGRVGQGLQVGHQQDDAGHGHQGHDGAEVVDVAPKLGRGPAVGRQADRGPADRHGRIEHAHGRVTPLRRHVLDRDGQHVGVAAAEPEPGQEPHPQEHVGVGRLHGQGREHAEQRQPSRPAPTCGRTRSARRPPIMAPKNRPKVLIEANRPLVPMNPPQKPAPVVRWKQRRQHRHGHSRAPAGRSLRRTRRGSRPPRPGRLGSDRTRSTPYWFPPTSIFPEVRAKSPPKAIEIFVRR